MMAAGSSENPDPPGDEDQDPVLPPDPRDRIRRSFLIDAEVDRLLRAEALRRETTEAAILRELLRHHVRLP